MFFAFLMGGNGFVRVKGRRDKAAAQPLGSCQGGAQALSGKRTYLTF